jgi:iron complex outermembrane recepter protein
MNFKVHRFVRIAIALSVVPGLALAQEPAAAEDDELLDEIVVTAQKRQESLRDVPLSVEAILGDKLQEAGILRLDDLKAYVPNLQMTETGIANNIYIRGIGSGLNQGFEQSVSLFQDGVYHGRGHQSRMPFVDLARVEVLRGPQPILFGKNAVAGAVNLIAAQPTRDFETSARVSRDIENDETTADFAISGPFTDNFRGRLAGFHRHADGYMENATLGTDEPRRNEVGARMMLAADLGNALTATLRAEIGNFDSDGRQIEIFGETPITSGAFATLPTQYRTYSGALSYLIATNGGTTAPNPALIPAGLYGDNEADYVRSGTSESLSNNRFREAALTFDYALPGDATLTSVSAYSTYKLQEGCDCDFLAAPLITAGITEDYKQYSQELRFTSAVGERLQWIGGLYFQKYTLDESDVLHVPTAGEVTGLPSPIGSLVPGLVAQDANARNGVAAALSQAGQCAGGASGAACQQTAAAYIRGLFNGASNPRDFTQDSTMFSVFLQGKWQFNDKWSTTLGARVNHEKKDGRRNSWLTRNGGTRILTTEALPNGLFNNVLGIIQHDISGSRKETNVSPLLNLQYQATAQTMAYLSATRGYKSGGFDARSNKPPTSGGTFEYEDERATTFEVGVKTAARNGRAEGSIAVFNTDYKDLQTSAFDGRIGFNVGNGSAEVRGIEFEGRWRPVGPLTLKSSLAVLDFEWTEYQGQCYFDIVRTSACVNGNADYAGRTNALAPKFSGVVSAEYVARIGSLALTTTVDAVHSGSYLQSLNLDYRLKQEAYTKLNARISVGDAADVWQLALVGKNLTDKVTVGYAADAPLAQALFQARSYYGFVDPPRSIAVEARVRF